MTVIDWIIGIILVVSALISLSRGFVKEALSLATWVVALIVARTLAGRLSFLLTDYIGSQNWRIAAAFAILFVATLILGALINHIICAIVKATGLTGTDRLLGMVFGLLRGVIIVVAMLALMRLFALDQLWPDSVLIPYLEPVITWTGQYVHKASEALIQLGS